MFKLAVLSLFLFAPTNAFAQVEISETAFIFNTLLFLITSIIAMLCVVGFSLLETGAVKQKNTGLIVFKNSLLFAMSGIIFYLIGYNFVFESGAQINLFSDIYISFPEKLGWLPSDDSAKAGDYSSGYAASADWFFQMLLATITMLIVAGALGARIKLWSFAIFVAFLTGFIYPITAAWQWGGGWLAEEGFADFAGSTLVYSVGGWCALSGTLFLGARKKRFDSDNDALLRTNINFTSIGVFILWMVWLAINSGSQLSLGTAIDAIAISNIMANTHIAASSGMIAAMSLYWLISRKINLFLTLGGALGGLISISAEPLLPTPAQAIFIGAIGGAVVVCSTLFLNRMRVDDVSGTIPVFLACGIWGTLIVPFSNTNAEFATQISGTFAVAVFSLISSSILWFILDKTIGIRVEKETDLPRWE